MSTNMKKIKVLIADDIMILRQGLKAVLEQDEALHVVALAENGKEALEKTLAYQPDVVLMDMRMPDYDGAYGIAGIRERKPEVKILVLTTFDDDETIAKALESGADGYLLKEMEDEKVIAAVKGAYGGMSIFGDNVYRYMREQLAGKALTTGTPFDPEGIGASEEMHFTERERDMLRLLSQGYDNKEIALSLYLAEGTVRNQISRLLEKLQLKDRTQLAVYAVKHGLDT